MDKEEIKKAYIRLFNSDDGEKVLKDLKRRYKFSETLWHNKKEINNHLVDVGRQDVINHIVKIVTQEGK